MSGALKKSLASWTEEHGFAILCIRSPHGEHFVVGSPDAGNGGLSPKDGPISEHDARARLVQAGLSDLEADEAVDLARAWATTVSGGGMTAKLSGS